MDIDLSCSSLRWNAPAGVGAGGAGVAAAPNRCSARPNTMSSAASTPQARTTATLCRAAHVRACRHDEGGSTADMLDNSKSTGAYTSRLSLTFLLTGIYE